MSKKNMIMLELNELCPALIEKFMEQGHLPNFQKIRKNAQCYTTNVDCDVGHLEPWTQWVTVHTGLPSDRHLIHKLGQAQQLKYDSIWDILAKNDLSSWLCGSMNLKWDPLDDKIIALPDPWSINTKASPESLNVFYDFVRSNVQEHTNESHSLSARDYAKFLFFMLRHGLSLNTISEIIAQLYRQITKAPDKWRKPFILDWLQFDVFRYFYKKKQPSFATYFSNSTAHFQHKFWRYMEPKAFSLKPSSNEVEKYGNAILAAYQNHDKILGEALALADENTTIVVSTAISQRPFNEKDKEGGKRFYRPFDIRTFADRFGLSGVKEASPVMSHQFYLLCESSEDAQANKDLLSTAMIEGEQAFSLRIKDNRLFVGCRIIRVLPRDTELIYSGNKLMFFDIFYLADNLKSGGHHPQGVLWIYKQNQPQATHKELVPLEKVMNMLLSEFDIKSPATK